jgi:hypothetical protein
LLLNFNTNLLKDGLHRFVNTSCSVFRAVREKPRTKHGLLRELRDHRALRDSCRPPAGRDRTNVTGCREQPGRRWPRFVRMRRLPCYCRHPHVLVRSAPAISANHPHRHGCVLRIGGATR